MSWRILKSAIVCSCVVLFTTGCSSMSGKTDSGNQSSSTSVNNPKAYRIDPSKITYSPSTNGRVSIQAKEGFVTSDTVTSFQVKMKRNGFDIESDTVTMGASYERSVSAGAGDSIQFVVDTEEEDPTTLYAQIENSTVFPAPVLPIASYPASRVQATLAYDKMVVIAYPNTGENFDGTQYAISIDGPFSQDCVSYDQDPNTGVNCRDGLLDGSVELEQGDGFNYAVVVQCKQSDGSILESYVGYPHLPSSYTDGHILFSAQSCAAPGMNIDGEDNLAETFSDNYNMGRLFFCTNSEFPELDCTLTWLEIADPTIPSVDHKIIDTHIFKLKPDCMLSDTSLEAYNEQCLGNL